MKHVDPRRIGAASAVRRRAVIEARIEKLIAKLDRMDGDPDLEPEILNGPGYFNDIEGDRADDEPSLGSVGSCYLPGPQTRWASGGRTDLEQENEHGTDLDAGEGDEAEQEGDEGIDYEPEGDPADGYTEEVRIRFCQRDVRNAAAEARCAVWRLQDRRRWHSTKRAGDFVAINGLPVIGQTS